MWRWGIKYQPFKLDFSRCYAHEKIMFGIQDFLIFCRANHSQTSQTRQGRPRGQNIPAQPVRYIFSQMLRLQKSSPGATVCDACAQKWLCRKMLRSPTKCCDVPGVAGKILKRPMQAKIGLNQINQASPEVVLGS